MDHLEGLDKLYCSKCGSDNVTVGVNINPNEKIDINFHDSSLLEKDNCWCYHCCDSASLKTLQELWDMFSNVPINDEDEIEEDFLNFKAGTSRFEVWHWFDERCPNSLHDDLM